MITLLQIGRILAMSVWAIFGLSVIIIRIRKPNEWAAAFAGVKKMISSVVGLLIFLTPFNALLWANKLSIINNFPKPAIYALMGVGYLMIIIGFVIAMKVAMALSKPLPAGSKFNLYKHLRNSAYIGFTLIALGSCVSLMMTIPLLMVIIILIPFLAIRVKIENKANANL